MNRANDKIAQSVMHVATAKAAWANLCIDKPEGYLSWEEAKEILGVTPEIERMARVKPEYTVYLAGAINGKTDAECNDWREEATAFFSKGDKGDLNVLNPMARDFRGMEGDFAAQIIEGDKQDIDNADFLLVKYDKPSVGTSMEILYAWERGKKIILIVPEDGPPLSPWLQYHSHAVTHTVDAGCNAVYHEANVKVISEIQSILNRSFEPFARDVRVS